MKVFGATCGDARGSVAFSGSFAHAAILTVVGALARDGQSGLLFSSTLASAAIVKVFGATCGDARGERGIFKFIGLRCNSNRSWCSC